MLLEHLLSLGSIAPEFPGPVIKIGSMKGRSFPHVQHTVPWPYELFVWSRLEDNNGDTHNASGRICLESAI